MNAFNNGTGNRFCGYCGTRIDDDSKFCKNCGAPISGNESVQRQYPGADQPSNSGNRTGQRTTYAGKVYECPRCAQTIDSFCAVCPSCGYELRGAASASSVHELALKLDEISAEKMPEVAEQNSVMKMVFGRDFREDDKAEEARRLFKVHKNERKASLIINYSVPNTKEDIMEFMILASSNIDTKHVLYEHDEVVKAWIKKLDQVYQKAEISMGGTADFQQIKAIYDKKKKEIKMHKYKPIARTLGGVLIALFVLGIISNPTVTIGIAVLVGIVFLAIIFLIKKRTH